MNKNHVTLLFFIGLLLISSFAYPQPKNYSAGSVHLYPAWTLQKAGICFNSYSDLFFKDEKRDNSTESHSDIQINGSLFYGFTRHLELGISQVFYQSNHIPGSDSNAPDDLFLMAKLGSFGKKQSSIQLGLQGTLRLASGNVHNIPLQFYASDRATLGLTGLISIISDTCRPDMGINFHGNFGFLFHNDLGTNLTNNADDTIFVSENTRELLYGFSFSYVRNRVAVFTEFHGRSFIQKPPVTAYARESSLYVSPGFSFLITDWLRLKTALDLRLLGNSDETVYSDDLTHPTKLVRAWKNAPNYPDWRIHIGFTAMLRPGKPMIIQQTSRVEFKSEQKRELITELVKEREKTQNAETDLDRIRQERQQMEELLQSLRNILDGTPISENNK